MLIFFLQIYRVILDKKGENKPFFAGKCQSTPVFWCRFCGKYAEETENGMIICAYFLIILSDTNMSIFYIIEPINEINII